MEWTLLIVNSCFSAIICKTLTVVVREFFVRLTPFQRRPQVFVATSAKDVCVFDKSKSYEFIVNWHDYGGVIFQVVPIFFMDVENPYAIIFPYI